eukprot:8525545-Pyramimonas_sp.AAC.1
MADDAIDWPDWPERVERADFSVTVDWGVADPVAGYPAPLPPERAEERVGERFDRRSAARPVAADGVA